MAIDEAKLKPLHIAMFPWLAFGHLIPYLELAKLIAQKGHKVSFISTPRNIQRLPKLPPKLSPLINFVTLPLPKVNNNLPENAEATSDIPYDTIQYLKHSYDALQQPLTDFLETSNVDWIFHDFVSFWVPPIASKFGIRSAFFCIFAPPSMGFLGPTEVLMGKDTFRTKPEDFTVAPPWVPFPTTVAFRYFEIMKVADSISDNNDSGFSDSYRFGASIKNCDILVIRGCTEFEPEWFQLLENLHHKPIIPSGQLPSTRFESENESWLWMKEWLDKQPRGRTIYVAFGSEAKLSQEEVKEIALGLEKSKLSFFWVLRVRCGPTDIQMLRLPEGFEERTRGFGVVYTDWAPQMKILDHVAIGGFFTHSGRSSVIEGVQNGKPLILLSFLSDTGLNARVLQEKKMGYCVTRDERDGSFTSDSVAQAIRLVVVDEEGKIYREKIKEMKDLFVNSDRQDKYVDNLLNYLRIPLKH